MTSRQWLTTLTRLAIVAAAVLGWVASRDSGGPIAALRIGSATTPARLVDERPLQNARALAQLASGEQEREIADPITQFADNEVDLVFHTVMMAAG